MRIPIDEGPVFEIGKLDFKGDLFGTKEEYFARLSTKSGATFNRTRLGQDMQKLNDFYKDRGYAYVNVTPVKVEWKREHNLLSAVIPPSLEAGPWVVRVEINDDTGAIAGRDFLEVAPASIARSE